MLLHHQNHFATRKILEAKQNKHIQKHGIGFKSHCLHELNLKWQNCKWANGHEMVYVLLRINFKIWLQYLALQDQSKPKQREKRNWNSM